MSNFGKLKNIWNLDVVSREEMKTILQEWDDALSSFQNDINELKRLTTLKVFKDPSNHVASNWSVNGGNIDFSRPVYIEFKQSNLDTGAILKTYNYTVNFYDENNWIYLNDNVSIKYFSKDSSYRIGLNITNLPSRDIIGYINLKYTPKTLASTINETQEEGEAWETSK